MTFYATDPVSHSGQTNVWLTPRWILDALGPFDLDPCAHKGWSTARTHLYENGLEEQWFGRVWLNPPYGKHTRLWLGKLKEHGNGVALIFNRLDTHWLQALIADTPIFFIKGRVKFLTHNFTESTNAGTGSILIPFGDQNAEAISKSGIDGVWKT